MLGDIMNYSNISKKPVNTINPPSSRYSFTLPKKHINLNDIVGKYHSNTPINCVELKQKFKKGVLEWDIF